VDRRAKIGPNSVLQLVPVLDEHLGSEERERILKICHIDQLPSDQGLMPEGPAAELHQAVRRLYPELAPQLTREAGLRTAEYIIRHRIPVAALRVLRSLPPWLAAPLLASVIEKHAWTFAGSGGFKVRSRHPLVFELRDNPVVRGEHASEPICHWHAAVFEHLFRDIVDPRLSCRETHCCASGADACRFEVR
jgi:divinyl protochlorophyllide a 8-vinyl-reductase